MNRHFVIPASASYFGKLLDGFGLNEIWRFPTKAHPGVTRQGHIGLND